jgi:hypothetical protein
MEEFKVAEEVALPEVKAFIEYHLDIEISEDRSSNDFVDIQKLYKNILKAVKRGLLDISNPDAPVLTLKDPIKKEGGSVDTAEIKFKTRITKGTMANLSKGFDLVNNPIGFQNIITAYYTGLITPNYLNFLSKPDLGVVDEMVSLFQ